MVYDCETIQLYTCMINKCHFSEMPKLCDFCTVDVHGINKQMMHANCFDVILSWKVLDK